MAASLLVTKFFVPPSRPDLVPRPRLIESLLGNSDRKLILISAPAGFGKTTLVAEWLKSIQTDPAVSVVWLSLDRDDNDLARFLTYFVADVNRLPGMDISATEPQIGLIQDSGLLLPEALLARLINQLAGLPGSTYVVLDDYHVIDATAVNDAVTYLLDHLPPHFHLVITTREDPVLPLSRLRARGELAELRAADLRFSPTETAQFLNQSMRLDLAADEVSALEARTEGWIVGLQLAALSLKGQSDPAGLVRSFTGSHRWVLDYLVEEVLDRQTCDVQRFLLQTAILERFCAPLCDAVTGRSDSRDVLEWLDRANLFVIPLDHHRYWYRYHHLFAELLLQRLRQSQAARVPDLHLRASEWLAHEALMPEAIRHALAARDFERAADLAEVAWPDWDAGFRSLQWLEWVKALPDATLQSRPVLCVACAQAHLNGGHLEAAEARLQDAERCLDQTGEAGDLRQATPATIIIIDGAQHRELPARVATTRAYLAQARGDASATIHYVGQALGLIPEHDAGNRTSLTLLRGLAHWTLGELDTASSVFARGLARDEPTFINGAFVLADMQKALGRLREAEAICQRGLAQAARTAPPHPIGTEDVHTALSHIHRERGDLAAAALDLETARRLGEQIDLPDWKHRWYIAQARLYESMGELDQALALLDTAARHHVRTPVPDVRPIAALKARVLVKQGKVMQARQWACDLGLSADDQPSYFREFEYVTLARTLIAQGQADRDPAVLHAAQGLLDRLIRSAEGAGRTGSLIEILILKARALEAQNNVPAALKPLKQALALAEPEGYFRVFVDEGLPMARLLYEALAEGPSQSYVQRLLDAFPEVRGRSALQHPQAPGEGLEPLSDRERDVLQLIADGLSNQDIGDRLFLALNTVKAHTRSIYGKLGVNSRTQAIARARALGLLKSA